MARRRGGSRPSGRRGFSSSASKSPPPTPTARAPPPQQSQGGGLFSGLAGTMMQGAALGTGSAFAHRAVDGLMGGRGEAVPQEAAAPAASQSVDACHHQSKAFADCVSANNGDIATCQFYFDMLQQCKMQTQM